MGWSYVVLGLDRDPLLYSVLVPFRSLLPPPAAVTDAAEQLVRSGRVPEHEYQEERDGAPALRTAIRDFHRTMWGLSPMGRQDPAATTRMAERIDRIEGTGVQLTIDTQTDTYEQAIAAVQAAYGLNPTASASSWPDAPALEPRPAPEDLSEKELWEGWTDRMLFDTVASVMPGARAVLRRLVELGGTASYDGIQDHFAAHPQTPIARGKIGGTLTSVRAVRRKVGPNNRVEVLTRDDRARTYRIEPLLVEGLRRAFDLADARPDLLRQGPADRGRPACGRLQ